MKNSARYSRQILFEGIGSEGQAALGDARILILGCGALGASHAEMLSRAGVGFMRIVDRDFVEFSNLQRQTLFTEKDARGSVPKAVAAKNRLSEINSEVRVDAVVADVNVSNAEELIEDVDLVIDGSDNFQVRYLINDACVKTGKSWIYGAAVSSYGTTMTVIPEKTACLRCIFDEMPAAGSSPTCDTAGVIQPIISSISAIQVSEALKLIVGNVERLHGSLLQIDVWMNDWRRIKLTGPNPDCLTCGKREFEFLNEAAQESLTTLCGRNAVQIRPAGESGIDLTMISDSLGKSFEVEMNEYLLRFTYEDFRITLFKDARAIIQGTEDVARARSLYARFIGT